MLSYFVRLRTTGATLRLVVLSDVHIPSCLVWKIGKVIEDEGSKGRGELGPEVTFISSEAVPQVAHGNLS